MLLLFCRFVLCFPLLPFPFSFLPFSSFFFFFVVSFVIPPSRSLILIGFTFSVFCILLLLFYFWQAVHSERCTALHGVPTMFIAELNHPDFHKYDMSSLRTGIMGMSCCRCCSSRVAVIAIVAFVAFVFVTTSIDFLCIALCFVVSCYVALYCFVTLYLIV